MSAAAALDPAAGALLVAAPLRMEARALRQGAPELRVLRTGMGPARSRRAARRIGEAAASRIAVAGLCGALDRGLAPGDVVVASELRGDGRRERLRPMPGLLECLAARGLRVQVGALVSLPHLVRGTERLLWHARGARAADMESAWLARGAAGRPVAVVRVVLDAPDHEILRPGFARSLRRALRALRQVAAALEDWNEAEGAPAPLRRED